MCMVREEASALGLKTGVIAITTGGYHTCALSSVGAVQCWGCNADGQLGDGTEEDRHTPTLVSGLGSGIVAVSAGGGHTCAIDSVGEAKCWGWNWRGQLGNGTTDRSAFPVRVEGLDTGVVAISTGHAHTCVLTSDAQAACWGFSMWGQLGDGAACEQEGVPCARTTSPVTVIGFQ